jgi:hypothetical protein
LIVVATLLLTPTAASAAWTVSPTPNVDGASSTNLSAVDCTSADSCMAVGQATFNAPGGTAATVAEHWDGTSWQIVPTPNPPGATYSSLNGVSCPWPNVCFAVGGPGPLVELWNGTSWSIQPTPELTSGGLNAVSCSGLLACTAVGSDGPGTLAARWDGTGWHVQSNPSPPGSQFSSPAGVSCPRKRTCTAVGQSFDGAVNSPLAERWFGRVNAWGLQAAPKPAGAESGSLNGVSCPDGPVCVAVGSSSPPGGSRAVMAERRIGSNWSVLPVHDPAQGTFLGSNFLAVSCPARRACRAAGSSGSPSPLGPPFIPIAGRFDGSSWQLEAVPSSGLGLAPFLAGVSCPNRLFCMAVGGYNTRFQGGTLSAKWTP